MAADVQDAVFLVKFKIETIEIEIIDKREYNRTYLKQCSFTYMYSMT